MTNPTPEERAYAAGIGRGWNLDTEKKVAEMIRAAVAAENERCVWSADEYACVRLSISPREAAGLAAAIRARGESDDRS